MVDGLAAVSEVKQIAGQGKLQISRGCCGNVVKSLEEHCAEKCVLRREQQMVAPDAHRHG